MLLCEILTTNDSVLIKRIHVAKSATISPIFKKKWRKIVINRMPDKNW